jgi:dienelactone hydrolase
MTRLFLHLLALAGMLLDYSLALAEDCRPAPADVAVLREIRPQFHTVDGPLAEFDPCHASVKFQKPFFSLRPPLLIVVHGGGGVDSSTRNAAEAFRGKGFATLVFDAYEHNGFDKGFRFWATQASNEARQRMLYKVTLGAYQWALSRSDIDTGHIYFHGLSNGAIVLANIAAAVSPRHVKGVFAEGAPGMGLGLPDAVAVPLRMIYGRQDNYGGKTEDEWIWLRQERCHLNVAAFLHPAGNARTCSADVNRNGLTQRPIDWFEDQKRKGADIELWFYDNAAHGIFAGPLQRNTIVYGRDMRRFAWIGADASARHQLLDDILRFHQSRP